jgi:2-oxoglutarate dehydrogenase E1 component
MSATRARTPRREGEGGEPSTEESVERFGLNAAVVDEIRRRYEVDPGSVDPSWGEVFEGRPPQEAPRAPAQEPGAALSLPPGLAEKHARVLRLIHAYSIPWAVGRSTSPSSIRPTTASATATSASPAWRETSRAAPSRRWGTSWSA